MKKLKINPNKIYSSSEIIKILKLDGWELFQTESSHFQFKHPTKKGKVTVKHPDKDVPLPTARSIWRQAGVL